MLLRSDGGTKSADPDQPYPVITCELARVGLGRGLDEGE